jgi:hypothetical protein
MYGLSGRDGLCKLLNLTGFRLGIVSIQAKMPSTARDCCKGPRAAYNAVLTLIASNNVVAIIVAGVPVYLLVGLSIVYSTQGNPAFMVFSSATYTIMTVLILSWVLFAVATYRIYPNLMFISIFLYKCLGHWSLVSLFVMFVYGARYVPLGVLWYLLSNFFPLIGTLLICGEVMRRVRQRLFDEIQRAGADRVMDSGGLAPVVEGGAGVSV